MVTCDMRVDRTHLAASIVAAGFKAALGHGYVRVVAGIVVALVGIVVLIMMDRGRW